jgi:fucose permease
MKWDAIRTAPLYLTFAATGVCIALPGALLPMLLTRWHLGDEQGGRLFLMAWIGSAIGALLVRGSLRRVLVLGTLATALAAVLLGICNGAGADAWMLLYGTGLGLTMTGTSLMRQQQTAERNEDVGREMVRLNLVWALGAVAGPSLTMKALTGGVLLPLLLSVAAFFALASAAMLLQPEIALLTARDERESWLRLFRSAPFGLVLMTATIVGTEASAGAWLATYTRRGGHSLTDTIAAPTALWAGLLLSRAMWSLKLRVSQVVTVRGSLGLMTLASVLLLATNSAWVVLGAAFCMGFGIGPVYPLLLAWVLNFYRGGAIFFMAGLGSSLMPWLTGVVSARTGSLRTGLVVPMLGTMAMLALASLSPVDRWSRAGS